MNNTQLNFLKIAFKTFREKEAIEEGKVTKLMGYEVDDIFCMLVNVCWKKKNNIKLTDLEKIIKEEAGYISRMFAAEIFQASSFLEQKTIPFPQYNISIEDYKIMLTNYIDNQRESNQTQTCGYQKRI